MDAALSAYLDAFKADDYNTMYAMLSKVSQDAITLEDFAKRNRDALNEMSAGSFDYEVLSSLVNPYSAEVSYRVTYHTALVGDIQRDMVARFALENGEWKLNGMMDSSFLNWQAATSCRWITASPRVATSMTAMAMCLPPSRMRMPSASSRQCHR